MRKGREVEARGLKNEEGEKTEVETHVHDLLPIISKAKSSEKLRVFFVLSAFFVCLFNNSFKSKT